MNSTEAVVRLVLLGTMLLLLVGGAVAMLLLWYLRGRDPHTGLVADILSEPPDDLSPGAVGTLLDEHADHEDVVATLLGLGRNGAVVIEAASTPNPRARDYRITLLHPERITRPLERDLLRVLFGPDPQPMMEVLLDQVRSRFVDAEPKIRDDLYEELVQRHYFAMNPHQTRERWRRISRAGLVLSLVVGLILSVLVDPFAIATTIASAIIWTAMIRMSRHMPRKTPEGSEAAAKWRAFKRYLQSIEPQRDLKEASDIFDRYLSYAVALKMDRQWIGMFSAVGVAKPGWFGGPDIGDIVILGDMGNLGDVAGAGRLFGDLGGSVPDMSMPNVSGTSMQGAADALGGSLQVASDGLTGLLDAAGSIFDDIDFDL